MRPNTRMHIKGLARELDVSPNTAQFYTQLYEKEGILRAERVANSKQFSLNNEDFLSIEAKRFWFLATLKDSGFVERMMARNPAMSTLVLFGAFAKGDFTDHSDIDVLAISQSAIDDAPIKELERKLGREADLIKLSPAKWRQMSKSQDKFALSVTKNHVILWGSEL